MDVFTELKLTVKDYKGEVSVVTITEPAWDCDIDKMADIFERLLLAEGFMPESVNNLFFGQEAE